VPMVGWKLLKGEVDRIGTRASSLNTAYSAIIPSRFAFAKTVGQVVGVNAVRREYQRGWTQPAYGRRS